MHFSFLRKISYLLRLLIASFGLMFVTAAYAQTAKLNVDYKIIASAPPYNSDKIVVTEFFSYACPHCASFHPFIKKWANALPEDVQFERIPISFGRSSWKNLALLYHALKLNEGLSRLDDLVFSAIHDNRKNLFTLPKQLDWLEENGADRQKYAKAFKSFTVNTEYTKGEKLSKDLNVAFVPMLVVNNRYQVISDQRSARQKIISLGRIVEDLRAGQLK